MIGFAAYHGSNSNFREYISTTFSTPMVSGTTYNVSFWLTNGISGQCYGHSADGIGVRFSTSALTQLGTDPVGGTPHWEVPGEVWATSWQQFSFTFTADDNYTHITIGNFYDDANTSNSFQVLSLIHI